MLVQYLDTLSLLLIGVVGYPGGAILPVYDSLYNSSHFEFILPRYNRNCQFVIGSAKSNQARAICRSYGPGLCSS